MRLAQLRKIVLEKTGITKFTFVSQNIISEHKKYVLQFLTQEPMRGQDLLALTGLTKKRLRDIIKSLVDDNAIIVDSSGPRAKFALPEKSKRKKKEEPEEPEVETEDPKVETDESENSDESESEVDGEATE